MKKNLIIIGYSGHSYGIIEALLENNYEINGYCDIEKKDFNPFNLKYLGKERDKNFLRMIKSNSFFISIGLNKKRQEIAKYILKNNGSIINAINSRSSISKSARIGLGNFIGENAIINSFSTIENYTIINTSSVVEHECIIENGAQLGPGSVICGNVRVKKGAFIGANSTVKQNLIIGANSIIGAGSVITKNVPDNSILYGNPAKLL